MTYCSCTYAHMCLNLSQILDMSAVMVTICKTEGFLHLNKQFPFIQQAKQIIHFMPPSQHHHTTSNHFCSYTRYNN